MLLFVDSSVDILFDVGTFGIGRVGRVDEIMLRWVWWGMCGSGRCVGATVLASGYTVVTIDEWKLLKWVCMVEP